MQKISAIIITLNEERNIERCLQSLDKVADEIIVVDSFSTDKTKEICELYNVKFFPTEWKGYAETKNYAHTLAENDWILSIDADEELSDDLRFKILEIKDNLNGSYRFHRLTNYCGKWIKHGGWYPDKKIRLFNRKEAKWEGNFVHEELIINKNVKVKDIPLNILHYSYYTIEEHQRRSEKYAKLAAEKIAAKNKNVGFKKIFSPISRFLQMYFLKLGFLDGYYGFVIAKITAREVKLKYKWADEILRK